MWKLARVWATHDPAWLLDGFDDTHHIFDDGSIEILLWPGDVARLEATGLRFQITVEDLVARDAAMEAAARTLRAAGTAAGGDARRAVPGAR